MAVDMSNPPTKDFLSSPALSLSLAGIFRDAASGSKNAEEEEEIDFYRDGGGRNQTVEISSENSVPTRSRSEDDFEGDDHDDDDDDPTKNKKKKRKKYHRHTADQIRHMEALFKETPHPDEKQRQQLSKQLGLAPRQVKFWFQNRRTQIKAIQERHENSLLKSELEKLRDENKAMRESIAKACCPNCGLPSSTSTAPDDHHLRLEYAKLKAEVERLRASTGKYSQNQQASASTTTSSSDDHHEQRLVSSLDLYTGIFGLDKSRILEMANRATDELQKMAKAGEPLWIRSVETGHEILNYDEYLKEFPLPQLSSSSSSKKSIEASREVGIVFMDIQKLLHSFMDVNQWKEMFPCMISKAETVDIVRQGEGPNGINGAIQLMFGEIQMLTPVVASREVYFVRACRQLSPDKWAIVDVSIDNVEDNIDASLVKCRKRPSGCIIEDKSNGHCKVTWVEHLECQKSTVHTLYRSVVNSGLAFGARHWIATLQLQCERLVFFMATNVPTKDSIGIYTHTHIHYIYIYSRHWRGGFYRAIGASSYHQWSRITTKTGEDIRVSSRKNLNDPGEPLGVIVCAASSLWLPVPPTVLFDFLRDETRRHEWDILTNGAHVQSIASLSKGQDRGNSVTVHAVKTREKSMWVLQDSCTNSYESAVIYAPVDINATQVAMGGRDPSDIQILPSGFSIIPDGEESRPLVIRSSRQDEKNSEGGSLLTVALQSPVVHASISAKPTRDSVESVTAIVSIILQNIKRCLRIEDS
ncbi:PREDICTED: homeobox-leucine zipper protein GLABRA 2 [Tarenaya hassleriana]|uniref:homeobox-leucine zipper protein GLABRA 2 n=1 Tax=Tarenaya hassleriana TaxID=28532 RepID=UPI00053C71EB|nr:PREDICTED: homeobox-leucine zipper protein GLABRA 2 [Tarenaya hassleriana]